MSAENVFLPGVQPQAKRGRCAKCGNAAGWVSICGNLLVALPKWYIGIVCNSQAVLADALHSTIDTAGSIIGLFSVKAARKPPSERYPYGFGKLEDLAACAITLIILGAGVAICYKAITALLAGDYTQPEAPALVVTVLSIASNIGLYFFIDCAGRHMNSASLRALAQENRADALSSVAVLIGVAGAIAGVKPLDPLAALVVGLVIIFGNGHRFYEAAVRLTDSALPEAVRTQITHIALATPFVQGILALRTRSLGTFGHADLDVLVDADISIDAAQTLAKSLAARLRAEVHDIGSINVRTHPAAADTDPHAARLDALLASLAELRNRPQKTT